jgi:DUF1680 family protein
MLQVNGEPIDIHALSKNGYAKIERMWKHYDQVSLQLPMPPVRMYAYPEIAADTGLVALQRGPIVYCLESTDNEVPLHRLVLPRTSSVQVRDNEDTLGGAVTLVADAMALDTSSWGNLLYRTEPPETYPTTLKAIPYYLWCNRGASTMRIWIHEETKP